MQDNIIQLPRVNKSGVTNNQGLEMLLRDSMDNIEDYSFQLFFSAHLDTIDDFEILPVHVDYSQANAQAMA